MFESFSFLRFRGDKLFLSRDRKRKTGNKFWKDEKERLEILSFSINSEISGTSSLRNSSYKRGENNKKIDRKTKVC